MNIPAHITHSLLQREKNLLLRQLSLPAKGVDFFSNDYLGLANKEEIAASTKQIVEEYGASTQMGASGSRLISGNSMLAMDFEKYLAEFFGTESALFFSSGYLANVGLFSTLPQRGDTVLYDELSHACIKDGIRLSLATRFPFKHNNLQELEAKLKKSSGNVYIAVESIYSMNGDEAPLAQIVALCRHYNAYLLVDEAHSTGIYGSNGSGLVAELGLQNHVLARVHTFGKAVGAHGACIVGPRPLSDYLVNFCRPFIYTTAPSAHQLAHVWAALAFLKKHYLPLKEALWENIRLFSHWVKHSNLEFLASKSPIQAVMMSGNAQALEVNNHLIAEGFNTKAILSPTVKSGEERIRLCLHSYNTHSQIENLLHALEGALFNN